MKKMCPMCGGAGKIEDKQYARRQEIAKRRRLGQTYAEIGAALGITGQRVQQLAQVQRITNATYRRVFRAVAVAARRERHTYPKGCRCAECRAAHALRHRVYMAKRKERSAPA